MSSGGAAATGVVLGILMALAIGGVEGSTADLDSTATDAPSDVPTAVDGGTDSTELASWARESWSTGARTATAGTSVIDLGAGAKNDTRFLRATKMLDAATVPTAYETPSGS
ncbi:MAG TPA: hypothetical protein VFI46_18045 [Jiangellaceae bacterium]|nr:hypothetical protein [Jiangellaceae bacterium]